MASRCGDADVAQEQMDRLEREIASLQAKLTDVEERYGLEHLHLAVSASYVSGFLQNANIHNWLTTKAPRQLANLCEVVTAVGPRPR
jgi:hypothetical protein